MFRRVVMMGVGKASVAMSDALAETLVTGLLLGWLSPSMPNV